VYFYLVYSRDKDGLGVLGNILARIPADKLDDAGPTIEYLTKRREERVVQKRWRLDTVRVKRVQEVYSLMRRAALNRYRTEMTA